MREQAYRQGILVTRKFYVYEHWRTDLGQCFYVGKGSLNRAKNTSDRNSRYREIREDVRRAGSTIDIKFVATDLDERTAFEIEISRIQYWRNAGVDLANLTDGGEGFSGFARPLGIRQSESAKRKLSLARKGIKFSEDHRKKLSAKKMGVKRPPFTEETLAKMRTASARREALKREKYGDRVTRWSTLNRREPKA